MHDERINDGLVCMIGTNHSLAPVDARSHLTLTPEARDAVLPLVRSKLGATGVVLLSTCNRVELWASFDGVCTPERLISEDGIARPGDALLDAVCAVYNVDPKRYARYFACRSGDAAVSHLFHVACGLRSAIVAEDQIISQVKQAVAISRELDVADSCLEVLFRTAVTSAKQVKSGIRFTRAYATAVEQALDVLRAQGVDVAGTTCMVIGNGEYGRLAATTLAEAGARVLVTVRQYSHGSVVVPQGCESVPFANRYDYLGQCDVVMSATTSPHYTLTREQVESALGPEHTLAAVDLAVPRDIDPKVAEIAGCSLFDIDSFATEVGVENKQAIAAASKMLDSGMDEFWAWVRRRDEHANDKPLPLMFPLFVDLSDKRVVFIGGGTIALRRVRVLLPFAGDIEVHALEFTPELERFAADGSIELVRDAYRPHALDRADLVVACTNDASVNDEVWAECKRRGITVNVSSDRFKCDFYFPGIVAEDNMVVGISAGGKNHRRVKQLRARIERLIEEEDV